MIPTGRQRAKAISWAIGEASTHTKQIGVEFELLDVEGNPRITWYGYFTEKTLKDTIKSMRAMGWQGCDLEALDGLDTNEVQLVIEDEVKEDKETHEQRTVQRVRWVNRMGGLSMSNPLDASGLKAFAAQMRGAILALDPTNAKKYAQSQSPASKSVAPPSKPNGQTGPMSPEPPPFRDADIPF